MTTDLKKLITALYATYALGALVQVSPLGALVGSLAIIAALCVASAQRAKAKDTSFESHFRWLTRTFWIGGGVYLPVLTLVATAVICWRIDMNLLAAKMDSAGITPEDLAAGDPVKIMAAIKQFMAILLQVYGPLMRASTMAVSIPFFGWWLWRLQRGWAALKAGRPVAKVESWL